MKGTRKSRLVLHSAGSSALVNSSAVLRCHRLYLLTQSPKLSLSTYLTHAVKVGSTFWAYSIAWFTSFLLRYERAMPTFARLVTEVAPAAGCTASGKRAIAEA